jgi:uncharacterized membrane protein
MKMVNVFILLLIFIISFAYVTFIRKQKTKKDPVRLVGFLVVLLSIGLVLIILANIFDNQKDSTFLFSILFLQASMVIVYTAIKHQQKRIEFLEEKFNGQTSENLPHSSHT